MKISPLLSVPLIAAALLIPLAIGYQQWQDPATSKTPPPPPEINPSLPYQTEEAWSVFQVLQVLSDLESLASGGTLQPLQIQHISPLQYHFEHSGKKWDLSIRPGVWNPASYETFAKSLFPKADETQPSVDFTALATNLLTATQEVYLAENSRISDFLQQHPNSPEGHLQAAFLLGNLALSDYALDFRDARIPINRMIAHLAAADALGMSPQNPARQLTEILRLSICGLEADALTALKAWKSPATDSTIWANWRELLRLHNSENWMEGREFALSAPTAVQREYFRALSCRVGQEAASSFLKDAKAKPNTEFWRIANQSSMSVAMGHVFAEPLLKIEMAETARAAAAFGFHPDSKDFTWLKSYLDTPEGSPVQEDNGKLLIQVAGKNLFASRNQRNLLQGISDCFYFLRNQWGVKEYADSLEDWVRNQLPDVQLKPFLLRRIARTDAARIAANESCISLLFNHPEWVTPAMWASLNQNERGNRISSLTVSDFHSWFHPEVPVETAFEASWRLGQIGVGDESHVAWMDETYRRAPYSYSLAVQNAILENGNTSKDIKPETLEKWFAPFLEYDLFALLRVARAYQHDPDNYVKAMKRVLELDPDCYLTLGDYFVERNLPEQAAEAYLKAFQLANNRVWMANESAWLVKYLYNKGDLAMANQVAEDAAEVYSQRGLETFVWLMEKEGKWGKAVETARKIDERYREGKPISETGCLLRMNAADPDAARAEGYPEKLKTLFPEGLQKVKFEDFTEAPSKGILVQNTSPSLADFKMRKGSIIVALDGYRVDNYTQYSILNARSEAPEMSFIFWDGSKYQIVEGKLPGRLFGVNMMDFTQK